MGLREFTKQHYMNRLYDSCLTMALGCSITLILGSTKFCDWLANRGLYQEYCGLVNVPNMHEIYGVYYDFGAHIATHRDWSVNLPFLAYACNYYKDKDIMDTKSRLSEMPPIGYRGVINADSDGNELRLSSIEDKDTQPICFISYNQSGYSSHCRQYASIRCG